MIEVQPAEEMTDEEFRQHLTLRHIPYADFADLKGFHPGSTFAAVRPTHNTYHTYLHERFEYDHEH